MTHANSSHSHADAPPPHEGNESQSTAPEAQGLDSVVRIFQSPGPQSYALTGLAALGMVFAVMLLRGSPLGGLLIVLVGGSGMIFRKTSTPVLSLLILTYFLIFPNGIPWIHDQGFERRTSLQLDHMLLVGSILVYLSCHYRLYGLTKQAIPYEGRYPRRGEKPVCREFALVRAQEIPILLGVTAGVVVVGQVLWWVVEHVEPDPLATIPLRFVSRVPRIPGDSDQPPPALTRGLILVGILAIGTLIARGVFGYWWLRQLTLAEAGMILQDTSWDETRREPSRIELWRAWARKRSADRHRQTAVKQRVKGATK